MQFVVIAQDHEDDRDAGAPDRRAAGAHGALLFAATLLNDEGMVGSVMLVDLPNRADVERWLADEPDRAHGIWRQVDVTRGRSGPWFPLGAGTRHPVLTRRPARATPAALPGHQRPGRTQRRTGARRGGVAAVIRAASSASVVRPFGSRRVGCGQVPWLWHDRGVSGGLRVRDVVGAPVLPPARLASVVARVRASVARLHRGLAPPPVQVLEGLFGALDHAALAALCRLEVPDRLDGPVTVGELAQRVDADAELVRRLVGYGAGRGWLRIDRRGRVRPTPATRFLRRDHPGGWRAWVDFASGPEVVAAIARLGADPRAPDAFAAANGARFFDWYTAHPDRHRVFDEAMAAGGRLHGLALGAAIDWADTTRVCDVGGGTGALLGVLVDRNPHLRGVLFDLPPVVERAMRRPRIDVIAGDMFTGLPGGCDTYLLVNVLHDWDDTDAARLLRGVASAGTDAQRPRVIVVEGERRARPVDDIAARTDLLMLALAPGGRERTTPEFEALAARAGLRLHQTIPLPTGDRAHVMT